MNDPPLFTPDELNLMGDTRFFCGKAAVTKKVRSLLEHLHAGLKEELIGPDLLVPSGFDSHKAQLVKGENLEDFPYQYLDFPKHFTGGDKFTFRSMFWWGHHFVFALLLEGEGLLRYKQNLINRFHSVAGQHLSLCLSPSLWEWKRGEGYTLRITHERKSQIAAVLSGRHSFKVARFVPPEDSAIRDGRIVQVGRDAFRAVLPIITT